jgi:hypothetical protein
VLTLVGAFRLLDGLRVQSAASDNNGGGVRALRARDQRGVALNIDVD